MPASSSEVYDMLDMLDKFSVPRTLYNEAIGVWH